MSTHNALGYFGVRFDSEEVAETSHRYAILSSPRTGSNYLCARLHNVNARLGIPMEYLHIDAVRAMGSRLFSGGALTLSVETYLEAVARVRTTGDGWFGTKIQPEQLLALFNKDFGTIVGFLRSFDRLIFITRRDKLGQAVSGAIARATGVWFNFGEEPDIDDKDIARLFPHIDRLQLQYAQEEGLFRAIAGQLVGRPLLEISYEEIVQDPEEVFRRVVVFLGVDDRARTQEEIIALPTQKPAGALAERVRTAYLTRLARGQ